MPRNDLPGRQQRQGGAAGEQRTGSSSESRINKEKIREALSEEGEKLVDLAEKVAENLARDEVAKTQLRKVFGEIRKMHLKFISEYKADDQLANVQVIKETKNRLIMLKPRLAYAAARIRALEELRDVVSTCVTIIVSYEGEEFRRQFIAFVNFFEAVLAFHRARG